MVDFRQRITSAGKAIMQGDEASSAAAPAFVQNHVETGAVKNLFAKGMNRISDELMITRQTFPPEEAARIVEQFSQAQIRELGLRSVLSKDKPGTLHITVKTEPFLLAVGHAYLDKKTANAAL